MQLREPGGGSSSSRSVTDDSQNLANSGVLILGDADLEQGTCNGGGTSVSTLSVETSTRGSSTSTCSPTSFSQRVTVPSVTDSPRAGSRTSVPEAEPAAGAGAATGAAAGSAGAAGAAAAGAAGSSNAGTVANDSQSSANLDVLVLRNENLLDNACYGGGNLGVNLVGGNLNQGASTSMVSPTSTSQRVTVPSVTDSPSAGSTTVWDIIFPVLLGECLN